MTEPGDTFFGRSATARVIGHRGCRIPSFVENTLDAMRRAVADGALAIELDVRLTRDGRPVVIHDADLTRVAGVSRAVRDMTAEEVTAVPLPFDQRVPTLDSVLRWSVREGVGVNVELKFESGDRSAVIEATIDAVRKVIRDARAEAWVIVSSFDPDAVRAWSLAQPSVPAALLVEDAGGIKAWGALPDIAALHPRHTLVDRALVEVAHARGQAVNVWTVNEHDPIRRMLALGVDGVITDVPANVRAASGGAGAR